MLPLQRRKLRHRQAKELIQELGFEPRETEARLTFFYNACWFALQSWGPCQITELPSYPPGHS
jgi:hypothetical protein